MRQNRWGGENHERTARKPGDKAPGEKPEKRDREGTRKKGRRGQAHHQLQCQRDRNSRCKRSAKHRAREITREIGRAEIGGDRWFEPMPGDDRGQQRRIGKPRQADADEAGAKGRKGRAPRIYAHRVHAVRFVPIHLLVHFRLPRLSELIDGRKLRCVDLSFKMNIYDICYL